MAYQKQQPYGTEMPTYLDYECERHEILLVDSDDSMIRIKLVNLHEFTYIEILALMRALCLLKRRIYIIGEFKSNHARGG